MSGFNKKKEVKSTRKFCLNKCINRNFSALLKRFFVNFKPVFKNTHIHVDGLTAFSACVKRLGLGFKFGFKFPVEGRVPVLFILVCRLGFGRPSNMTTAYRVFLRISPSGSHLQKGTILY